ncbi:MAG: flagellar brake protein [Nitrospinae bacterium]|nr:flagellar brake protein [Nitrospinota bacterium]
MVKVLKNIRLPIGERCQIQIDQGKYPSAIRGYDFPRYALLEGPLSHGKPMVVPVGLVYVVRYIHKGHVYGFESQLVREYSTPIRLWVMKYPDEVQIISLRQSKRISTYIPATLEVKNQKREGALIDLSEGGGLFTSNGGEIEQGAEGHISMTLPNGEEIKSLSCKVRSSAYINGKLTAGVSFNPAQEDQYNRVRTFYFSVAGQI